MSSAGKGELLNQQYIDEGPERILKLSAQLDPELPAAARREQQIWRITAFRSHGQPTVEHLELAVPSIMLLEPDQPRVRWSMLLGCSLWPLLKTLCSIMTTSPAARC